MRTRSFLCTLLAAMLSLQSFAYDFMTNQGYFRIVSNTENTVALTKGENSPSIYIRDFTIPSTVKYNNITYTVTTIDNVAFVGCRSLNSLVIGPNITTIYYLNVDDCPGLMKVTLNCNNYLKNITSASSAVNRVFGDRVQEYVIGNDVVNMGNGTFYKCSKVKKVTIGNNVQSIPEEMFRECTSLTEINIPASVQTYGYRSFYGCTAIKTVSIDNTSFLAGVNCGSYFGFQVEKYIIGSNVTSIGSNAFANCGNIKSVTLNCGQVLAQTFTPTYRFNTIFGPQVEEYIIGDNVTKIGNYAFSECSNVKSFTMGKKVEEIGECAFSGCRLIPELTFPATLTRVGEDAFVGCTYFMKAVFANLESLCRIEYGSLTANPIFQAKHLYLGSSKSEVTTITIPSNVEHINDYAFAGCSSVTAITLPVNLRSIGNYAFYDCNSLESIVVGDEVESIGTSAFEHCINLSNVVLGKGLQSLGENAFLTTSVENIRVEAENPPVCAGDILSDEAYMYVQIQVPNDSYATADIWKKFSNQEISMPGTIDTNSSDSADTNGLDEMEENAAGAVPTAYYDISGKRYSEPQPGINIVRYSDGTSRKILVK